PRPQPRSTLFPYTTLFRSSPNQTIQLRTASDFANTLKIHVNYLNKVLKETTGKTTTEIIASRINQEAKILLRQTTWNISEIAYSDRKSTRLNSSHVKISYA